MACNRSRSREEAPHLPCAPGAPTANKIDWSSGQASHLTWTANTNPANGLPTFTAQITSGPLAGDTLTGLPVVIYPNLDFACNGLSSFTAALAAANFA